MTCDVHVVDDVLTYIWCHHVERSLPRDTICYLLDNWNPISTEKLKVARDKLSELIPPEPRKSLKLQQRRAGEKQRQLLVSDIVDVFNSDAFVSLEPKPTFVCKDVTCLPPASPKEADLAFLLKKLGEMQDRLAITEAGQRDIADRVAIVEASCLPVIPVSGQRSWADRVAGPAPMVTGATLPAPQSSDARPRKPSVVHAAGDVDGNNTTRPERSAFMASRSNSAGNRANNAGSAISNDDGFTTVGRRGRPLRQAPMLSAPDGRRRPRRDAVRGTGSGGKLTVAPRPDAKLFLTGLGTDVTPDMIKSHVDEATGGTVSLKDCYTVGKSTRVASFCITVDGDKRDALLVPDIWPAHCSIRKYYMAKPSNEQSTTTPIESGTVKGSASAAAAGDNVRRGDSNDDTMHQSTDNQPSAGTLEGTFTLSQ